MNTLWGVAQMVERDAVNVDVAGSSPASSATTSLLHSPVRNSVSFLIFVLFVIAVVGF
jgi:hypothetical protein